MPWAGQAGRCRCVERSSGAQSWQAAGGELWRGWSVEDGSERHRGGWRSGRKRNGRSRLEEDNDNALGVSLGDDDNDSPSFSPTLPLASFPPSPAGTTGSLSPFSRQHGRRALPSLTGVARVVGLLSPFSCRGGRPPLPFLQSMRPPPPILRRQRALASLLSAAARPLLSPLMRRCLSCDALSANVRWKKRKTIGWHADPTFFFYHLHMDPHNFFIPSLRIRMPR